MSDTHGEVVIRSLFNSSLIGKVGSACHDAEYGAVTTAVDVFWVRLSWSDRQR